MANTRIMGGILVAIVGLLIPAALAWLLGQGAKWTPSDVVALATAFIGVVGTLVGGFLGAQVGSEGREKAEEVARRALAALPPDQARQIQP